MPNSSNRICTFKRARQLKAADPYHALNAHLDLLERLRKAKSLRVACLHGQILQQRHAAGPLAEVVPLEQFVDAELFLFIRGEFIKQDRSGSIAWFPWSSLYAHEAPRFLVRAVRAKDAEQLLRPLGAPSIEVLRERLPEFAARLREAVPNVLSFRPFGGFDVRTVASRG